MTSIFAGSMRRRRDSSSRAGVLTVMTRRACRSAPAVEAQGDEPLGKGVEVRITQEIEVGDGHHRRNAPQVYGERQRGSEAVVQVEVPIALCVNDIFMFRSVILQHPGQVLKVIAPERDRGRIESYFHNLFLKNCSIWQIIVIFGVVTTLLFVYKNKVLYEESAPYPVVRGCRGCGGAAAQNIVLGDRVPELKISKWLDDNQPEAAPATYIEFFHSSNPACIASLKRLKEITDKTGAKLRVIVVTKEDAAKVTPLLRPYLSKRIGAALGTEKAFTAFGVTYVPFGVLTDARNRATWMGNSLQFNEKLIEQTTR